MRKCRFCGKEISVASRVCEHCGRDLIPKVANGAADAGTESPSTPAAVEDVGWTQRVSVVDVNMPFASMVGFMAKWALASIPALFIVIGIAFVIGLLFALVFGGVIASLRPIR